MPLPQRTTIRLSPECYQYPSAPCSVTLAVINRQEVFGVKHDVFTRRSLDILHDVARIHQVPIHVALFMPDHVHICLQASPARTIIEFVKEIKSRIAREALSYGHISSFWQRSFFDHFLRKEETLETVIRYILDNPRRKQLIENWRNYPYRFSNQYTEEQLNHIA